MNMKSVLITIFNQTPRYLAVMLLIMLVGISFSIAIVSTYLCFAFASLSALILSNFLINLPYLKGIGDDPGFSGEEIIKGKILISISIWVLGVIISLIFIAILPYMQADDPAIQFEFYGYVHLVGIIFLTAFPFLAISELITYMTYKVGRRKMLYFNIMLLLSAFSAFIPILMNSYSPIVSDSLLALVVGSSVASISIIISIILIKKIIMEYDINVVVDS